MAKESSKSEGNHMCHICAQPDGAELVDIKESAARGDCLCCSVTAEALGKIIPEEESVNIKRSLESAFARVSIDGPGEYLYRDAGFCLDIFTNETKNTPAWISKQRVPSGDTSSDAALDWAKVWLDYCQREHEKCQLGEGLSFPTRIIEVTPFNERGDVRLIDQACRLPFDRYIALSHCWGKTLPSCRTLTTTLNQHITNIPFDNLPKTYQDAILFTRKLGIRWIWIDSICIVQDDISDWRHEAGKMSEVYGNSFVTLAAVHSWDSHGGLFSEVSRDYETFELSPISVDGSLLPLFGRRKLPNLHSWMFDPVYDREFYNDTPLFQRGWTYQERLVPKRVIYFSKQELLWECCQGLGCECAGDAGPTAQEPELHSQYHPSKNNPKIKHSKDLDQRVAVRRSYEIVEEYSGLALTFQTDKLPAISAIAKQIQSLRPHDRYLAGLWSSTLVQDLLWAPRTIELTRPKTYCAPTWSWASFTGEVLYQVPKSPPIHGHPYINYQYHAELLNAICKPISNNEYGQVESAQLILRAQLAECNVKHHKSGWLRYSTADVHTKYLRGPVYVHLDFMDDCREGETLYILRIAETEDEVEEESANYLFHHLLLRKNSETGVYYRVGSYFSWERKELKRSQQLFSGVPYTVVKIE